jgi:hypothetical protein
MIRHAVYHQPNGWDHVPAGKDHSNPMWAIIMHVKMLYIKRVIRKESYYTFFNGLI